MRKLLAECEKLDGGRWRVTVTDFDTNEAEVVEIEAKEERDAAFAAMEQVQWKK